MVCLLLFRLHGRIKSVLAVRNFGMTLERDLSFDLFMAGAVSDATEALTGFEWTFVASLLFVGRRLIHGTLYLLRMRD
jgi:hypothetical protein